MLNRHNTPEVITKIETAYGIKIIGFSEAGYGSGNWNYLLNTSQNSYVLCIIEEQTPEEVEVMAKTLIWLSKHNYPTTTLEVTIKNDLTIRVRGKQALLRRFLPGNVRKNLSSTQVNQVGAALGRLHQLPCPKFLPNDIYYTQPQFLSSLNSGCDPKYENWVKESLGIIDIHSYNNLPKGLIHADVFWDNVLFEGDDLVAIIDFELATNYILAFDLAMSIVGICMHGRNISVKLASSLISGYEQIRALTATERIAIKPLVQYAATMTSLWRYWRFQCHEPGHARQNSYLELAYLHLENLDDYLKNTS